MGGEGEHGGEQRAHGPAPLQLWWLLCHYATVPGFGVCYPSVMVNAGRELKGMVLGEGV